MTSSSFSSQYQFTMHSYGWGCMVNRNWKLELEKVILLSVFGNSKSKQTKNNIGKPEHFQDTKFRIRNWMDLFPCVANAIAICKSFQKLKLFSVENK